MVGIEIKGFEEIASNSKKLITLIEEYNLKATDENLKDLVKESAKLAPYKTGTLRRSIDKQVKATGEGNVSGQYGSDLPYAAITELGGTIPAHTVAPKNRKVLAWKDGGSAHAAKGGKYAGYVFSKVSHIPAQHRKAQPYLFPALINSMKAILWRYKKAWQLIESELGK